MSPYKNIEDAKRWGKNRYEKKKEQMKQRSKLNYEAKREYFRKYRANRYANDEAFRERCRAKGRERHLSLRKIVIDYYGGKCVCCGENEFLFLEIDHINNDGHKHRSIIGYSSGKLLRWIINNNFPNGFQVLCSNCNYGKRKNGGICPHKTRNL